MGKENVSGHRHLQLKEEQIFFSPNHFAFTDYGSLAYNLRTKIDWLHKDGNMSKEVKGSLRKEIVQRSREFGIRNQEELDDFCSQVDNIVGARVERLSAIPVDSGKKLVKVDA